MARSKSSAVKQPSKESQSTVLQFKPKAPLKGIADNIRDIIQAVGEDPERTGLIDTPVRSEKAYQYLTSGYRPISERLSIMHFSTWSMTRS